MSKNQEKLKLDIFPIPEGSILLDPLDFGTKEEKILLALKKLLKERKLESDLNLNIKNYFSEGIFYLNDFAIQIVTTGITSDQISIPIKTWLDNMAAFGKNREIEESIIGMILKDPNLIKEVMAIIPPDVFYIDIHKEIFKAALKIYSQGEDVSLENINKSLKENKIFKLSGGKRILNELVDNVLSDFSIKENIEVLKKAYIKAGGYGESPQIVLAVKFDDENNVIYFQGVITSKDFKSFLENNFEDYFNLQVEINEFQGGIDRLINYVEILDNDSLPNGIPYRQFLESRSKSIENKRNKVDKKNLDSTDYYLSSIGRVPLLTPAEEIELAHHVQNMKKLLKKPPKERSSKELFKIKIGKKARDRIMAANLRLVVAVAKKYQNQGLELLDLIQEGAIGLERAVDKFDPAMGYKFSTYAYWWIRQGITRAIDNSARTVRLPKNISEKLSKMRQVSRDLSLKFGRQPTRLEIATEMRIDQKDLEDLISQCAPSASINVPDLDNLDKKTLGELFEESNSETNSENTKPNIKVFGVGKAGINVLSNILQNQNIKKLLSYENIDTDTGTLKEKDSSSNLLIGKDSLQGLGTFGNPNYGEEAIQESEKLLQEKLNKENVIFVLAGMGGGTGSGVSPAIGRIAKEKNILTIAIVSAPAGFEGKRRMKQAQESIKKLHQNFDLVINIPYSGRPIEPDIDQTIQKEGLTTWLSQLNEREQKIMKLRFGLDGEEPLTLSEIGRQINVSRERVRQLEAKAILRLRNITENKLEEGDQIFRYTNKLMRETLEQIVGIILKKDCFFNNDFNDIKSLIKDSGKGIVGIGSGSGRSKALEAAQAAIYSSLLENSMNLESVKIDQAKRCLIIVRGGKDMTIEDITSVSEIIADFINKEAEIDLSTFLDEFMFDEIKITVLLTKFSDKPTKGKNLTNKNYMRKKISASTNYLDDLAV